ncbi:pentapeptide repeat-containing protein [Streptomyces sp. NPDC052016]|uniref:pentapeptide repeat-containing protein n=1 Tax=Streptomyces sp. NPDC052016 TaxID=3365680 RepID=UPI0037D95D96
MYIAGLAPGADIDHRGTPFDEPLLRALLGALRVAPNEQPLLGAAQFDGALFKNDANFDEATFSGKANFDGTTFFGRASFGSAMFAGAARFSATFTGATWFQGARFFGYAAFYKSTFAEAAWFEKATFNGAAAFTEAKFQGEAQFERARFHGEATFDRATFEHAAQFSSALFATQPVLGPLVCKEQVDLSGAVFEAPVTMEIAAREVNCARTRWASTAALRLRYATVDLSDAVLSAPVAVTFHADSFTSIIGTKRSGSVTTKLVVAVDESTMASTGANPRVRIKSVDGVDAAHLVLTDTDLTDCRFTGAFHLDQLRIEGNCTFADPPKRWRWTQRRVLAEEHHWRALPPGNPDPPRGWKPGPHHPKEALTPGPDELASVYRALRKATEDAKNEPDAVDFYYGEMEMRRHDRARPRGERVLLNLYWAVSGYGLRASRALAWLMVAMGLTVVLLMLLGLPTQSAGQRTTGTLTEGKVITLTTKARTVGGAAPGPLPDRFSWQRAERAARTAVNSVVFRSAGQGLTVAGTYIEMASRLVEPVLLALVLLAVRGRVKR